MGSFGHSNFKGMACRLSAGIFARVLGKTPVSVLIFSNALIVLIV